MKNRDFKDSRLIDAFSYIDPKYIAEVTDSLKLSNNSAAPIIAKSRSWRHIAALAACMLLLGALIPMTTYVLRNFGDIAAWFSDDTTEESNTLTEPETPPEEMTATPPDTTEEETTSEPQTTACTHPSMVTSEVIPNCTEKYTIYSWCSDCGYTENTIMPPYGHRFVNGICEICGATDECKHSLFTATENVPTCTESATVNYQCSSCGHTWSEVLPALGHNFVNNICTRCGLGIEYDGSRGLEYEISSDGKFAILIGIGTCTDKDIVIASTYNGLPVTSIASGALRDNKNVKSIKISDTVETIGYNAFSECTNLESVYISASVKEIGIEAFWLNNLSSITVDSKNEYFSGAGNCIIEKKSKTLLFGCASTVIPNDGSVEIIGMNAFYGIEGLTSITVPESITAIYPSAFSNCHDLVSISLPNNLKSIGAMAFYECEKLQSISLPSGITEINDWTFYNCSSLLKITGTENLTKIYPCAFENCTSLVSFTFGSKLTLIDSLAFKNCTSLKSIDIPASVTEIGEETFKNCTSLESVTIRGAVDMLYAGVFSHCSSLKNVNIAGVRAISHYAFEYCTALEHISLPASLKKLGTAAFNGCTSLKSINIPSGITEIGSHAFSGCESLTEIVIPEGVTIIHDEAFYLCKNLKKVTLPSTLEWIQYWAFAGCESLERITIPDSVTQISIRAFSDCKNLSSLTLGAGVELIEESAFENCTSLGYVKFPKSLRLLANDAFAGCTSLTNIHYDGTIQEWTSVDSTGRDYGNTHVWYEGVPGEKIICTNGYIFIFPISENEAYEAAREFLGIPKSQIGGIYEFVTKEKDQAHLDCYRVAYCEWKSDVGYMGQYEVLCEVYVNQYTGECEKVVYNYSDIPEVFLDVIFNREKFIFVDRYSNNETKESYLKTLELLPTCLFGAESQSYALLDIDGDSVPELIFSNSTLSSRGLILRYYDGKVYGYTWGGDSLMTDGTNPWHESAGEVQVLDILYFDGLLLKSREIMRYDFSDPQNVKYYVEGKETTKEEYEKAAAKYDGEYLKYSPLDLYPVYVNPFPGG